jgi:hypothetical protein
MATDTGHRDQWPSITKIAKFFHQDFGLLFNSVDEGLSIYVSSLDKNGMRLLSRELSIALEARKSQVAFKRFLLSQGAQWSTKNIRDNFVELLRSLKDQQDGDIGYSPAPLSEEQPGPSPTTLTATL